MNTGLQASRLPSARYNVNMVPSRIISGHEYHISNIDRRASIAMLLACSMYADSMYVGSKVGKTRWINSQKLSSYHLDRVLEEEPKGTSLSTWRCLASDHGHYND